MATKRRASRRLEQLAVDSGVRAGKPVTMSDVIRALVRAAFARRGRGPRAAARRAPVNV